MKFSTLLLVALLAGALASGCTQKKRIEGSDVPTQPQTTEATVPPPPMPDTSTPPAPEPTAEATPAATVPAPPEPPAPPAAEPTPEASNPVSRYIVVKGDTLWDISAMSLAYKDNFQWPLIFKANRDQIKDPDLIYPKQEFLIRHDFSLEDINKSRKDSSDTPVYVPHTKPRETLPVDYF